MTTTYTNITLTAVEQQEAADWLAENGYTAAVTPMIDEITVVFDNVFEDFADEDDPLEPLLALASEISYELGCAALLVMVEEDSTFIYSLYADGDLIDSYGTKREEAPEGGDAEVLAEVFGAPKRAIKNIRAALNRDIAQATERHTKLVEALELPPLAVGVSYASISEGALPPGIDNPDALMMVSAEDADDNTEESDNNEA